MNSYFILLTGMLYSNIEKKEACRFFKWLNKQTCARDMKVLAELTKKVKNLEDENDNYMAMIKDLENEIDSCEKRVKHLQNGDDNHWKSLSF